MGAASNYLENKVLDHTLKNTAYTQPSNLYLALFKNNSGNAAANLEANIITDEVSSGIGYVRKAITFSGAASGQTSNSANVVFDTATSAWGTVTHYAIMDAVSTGNVLYWGAFTTPRTVDAGNTMQVGATNLVISLD